MRRLEEQARSTLVPVFDLAKSKGRGFVVLQAGLKGLESRQDRFGFHQTDLECFWEDLRTDQIHPPVSVLGLRQRGRLVASQNQSNAFPSSV